MAYMSSSLENEKSFWEKTPDEVLELLKTQKSGLSEKEALLRNNKYGSNVLDDKKASFFSIFLRQFTNNPLTIILIIATLISYFLGDHVSSYYIFGIILVSAILGFWNEYVAEKTVADLLKKIAPTVLVVRNRENMEIPARDLTIGDIVVLFEGSIVPADLRLIETTSLEIDESTISGEAEGVYKDSKPFSRKFSNTNNVPNLAFMGTSVRSGKGIGVVIKIAKDTEFGRIVRSVNFQKPLTEFQKGLSGFGQLIIITVSIVAPLILTINLILGHPFLQSILFSLAISVDLTPELLPIIITVGLSHGAGKLARKHVIAKQLISIENLGNIDVLCTDKTGTLTEGKLEVRDVIDPNGNKNNQVLILSLLCNNASFHHKFIGDTIDAALLNYAMEKGSKIPEQYKITEIKPFDYEKRAMFSVIKDGKDTELIAKGSPEAILSFCGRQTNFNSLKNTLQFLNNDGLRTVVIATKKIKDKSKKNYSWSDLSNMTFAGYITFSDVPRKSVKETLMKLLSLNVSTKILTGDNELVAQKVCREVGMEVKDIILGEEIEKITAEELAKKVNSIDIFARITPEQKVKIIRALKHNGSTVGYLGDGVNDVPALHEADVGISVNTAIDVAKDAASVVLLRKDLEVLVNGIVEGRKTFVNTLKYVLMSTGSNFGEIISAGGASFFLPFFPMTPVQLLLENVLYDVSQISITGDNVDLELLAKPKKWNLSFIKNFMLFFGTLSAVYSFLVFIILFFVFKAGPSFFQTGWFIEAIITELLTVFSIRTIKTPFFKSRPGKWFALASIGAICFGVLLPFLNIKNLGFTPLPLSYFAVLAILVTTYMAILEKAKGNLLKKFNV